MTTNRWIRFFTIFAHACNQHVDYNGDKDNDNHDAISGNDDKDDDIHDDHDGKMQQKACKGFVGLRSF